MVISFIPGLYGYIFESAIIFLILIFIFEVKKWKNKIDKRMKNL